MSEPREFWIVPDNDSMSAQGFIYLRDAGHPKAVHVIVKSAYDALTKERDELKAEYAQLDKLYGKTRDERDNCKADILGLNDELEKFKAAHEYLPVIDVRRIGEIILQNKETKAENELLRQAARPLVHERLVKANDELAAWREQAERLAEALVWCDEMLTARDEMNSKVHCAPVRWSQITERVKQALAKYGEK